MDERLKYIAENLKSLTLGVDDTFKFHCDMCGKCCINREDILLNPQDIYRMAKELKMEPKDMFIRYCETYVGDNSRIPIVRIKPRGSIKRCPLMANHKCSVHKAKPTVCAMFPIGRCVQINPYKKAALDKTDIQYIFTKPGCGDDSETHTVREWLEDFGIPLEDDFYIKWNQLLCELGEICRKGEKILSEEGMDNVWSLIFFTIYLDYDTDKEFMPQFEKHSSEILAFMRLMPTKKQNKGGK